MKIFLNEREIETDAKSVFRLRNRGDVVILNGYQLSEDCPLRENDRVFIIEKGVMPGRECLEAMMAARHTPGVHRKVREGRVAVAGLGGLGSHIAAALARLGVGKMLLVDFDVVEPSNLNRQYYDLSHLGMLKTLALKTQIEKINPFVHVELCNARVTEENVIEIFRDYGVVCEAFDNPDCKALLVNHLLETGEKKIVAASGMAGFDSSNNIITQRKTENLYLCGDCECAAEVGRGLMAPRVMICAGHQANMVLRLLLNIEKV